MFASRKFSTTFGYHLKKTDMKTVTVISEGKRHTGKLSKIVKSTVSSELDLAFIDFNGFFRVALKSELIYKTL